MKSCEGVLSQFTKVEKDSSDLQNKLILSKTQKKVLEKRIEAWKSSLTQKVANQLHILCSWYH